MIHAGTDDGLLQVTEDGGKNWRKIEQLPGVPQWTYVTDVFASPREADTVFVALNNWQRGDYKPYLLKSADRGRTWSSIASDLPDRHDVWAIAQDHVTANLLFAGTEFGVFFSIDGGQRWVQLRGGMPVAQVRDLAIQKRENDLVLGTFGRGFYVLDDYSPLRELTPRALTEAAHLFPLRDAYLYSPTGQAPAGAASLTSMSGNWTTPNPPFGAVFTYSVATPLAAAERLVLAVMDESGKQVRRLEIDKAAGLKRVAWDLRADAPPLPPRGAASAGGAGGAGGGQGRGGGGVGGPRQGPIVAPGRYRAQLGTLAAEKVTPLGSEQAFTVVRIPR